MKTKRFLATFVLAVIFASLFSVTAFAKLPKNADISLYIEIPPGFTDVTFGGKERFGFKDDNGTRYDSGWEWVNEFPRVTSDRPGFVKYHFIINDWGDSDPEKGSTAMFSNHKLGGTKEDGTGVLFWDAWPKDQDDATATYSQKNHSIPVSNVDANNKVIVTIKWDTTINDYIIIQDNDPNAKAEPAVTAPAATTDTPAASTDTAAPAATTTTTAPAATTPSKSPATGDSDIALGLIVIVSGAFVFGLKKKLAKNN